METAKQMGAKKSSKCPHPAEDSRLTAWSIGIVKGKCYCIHNDPYGRGEQLGKCVKPDAPSTANTPPPLPSSPPLGSHFQVLWSLHKHMQLFLPPPLLLGPCLQVLQSLHKQTHLCIPPPTLPGSHLQALHSPHFCKHSPSIGQCPQSSLPPSHNFSIT